VVFQYIGEAREAGRTHKAFIQEVRIPLFERIYRPDNRSGLGRIRRGGIHLDAAFDSVVSFLALQR
jgi:hypothetical protein